MLRIRIYISSIKIVMNDEGYCCREVDLSWKALVPLIFKNKIYLLKSFFLFSELRSSQLLIIHIFESKL